VRLHSPRCGALTAAALLTCLLAGCGTAVDGTPSATATTVAEPTTGAAPTTTGTATPGPTAGRTPAPAPTKAAPATKDSGPVTLLPWPTADPARLQAAVDGGAQPWLLDPSDLADSYVSATYGWTAAASTTRPGGTSASTTVDVRNTDGARRTLTAAQPGRKGAGGIWRVTADTKA
jgi:nitrous oxide reductase accessory protein NosL